MKRRHKRIALIVAGLAALSVAVFLAAQAFRSNLVFFYSPSEVVAKAAPTGKTLRVGGRVETKSKVMDNDGLTVRFRITDTSQSIPVVFKGILPALFNEGKGCVAQGHLGSDGGFYADQVLAKHDENYMPPEAGKAIAAAQHEKEASRS